MGRNRSINDFYIIGKKAIIKLNREEETIVDKEDLENLLKHHWYLSTDNKNRMPLVVGKIKKDNGKYSQLTIGRFLKGLFFGDKQKIVYKDENPLNNTKENIIVSDKAQSLWRKNPNKGHKFKGIWKTGDNRYWIAQIKCRGEKYYLGCFKDEIEAARAYDNKAKELFGEFAYLNFPEGERNGVQT